MTPRVQGIAKLRQSIWMPQGSLKSGIYGRGAEGNRPPPDSLSKHVTKPQQNQQWPGLCPGPHWGSIAHDYRSSLKTGLVRPGKIRPGCFKNLTATDTHEFIQLFLYNRFNRATSQLVTGAFFHSVISSHGQVVIQSSRHKRALYKSTGRGPKFSGYVDIKGHYQRAKFGCLRLIRNGRG